MRTKSFVSSLMRAMRSRTVLMLQQLPTHVAATEGRAFEP